MATKEKTVLQERNESVCLTHHPRCCRPPKNPFSFTNKWVTNGLRVHQFPGAKDDTMSGASSSSSSLECLTVAVGSSNPAKIRSVVQALEQLVVEEVRVDAVGFSVASGVSDQPIGDEETKLGAKNRAKAALEAYRAQRQQQDPHLSIGLEGGLDETKTVCMAWMAVCGKRTDQILRVTKAPECKDGDWSIRKDDDDDDNMTWGVSKTGSFVLPPKVIHLIKEEGMELGDADDAVFARTKSKHGSGTVGILTKGIIDRSKYYEHAILLAMIPWIRPDVYPTSIE